MLAAALGSGGFVSTHAPSSSVSINVPELIEPTATQKAGDEQETPSSGESETPLGIGGVDDVHVEPARVTTSATSLLPLCEYPTATQDVAEAHETALSTLGIGPEPKDMVGVQVVPESVSTNALLAAVPTARHEVIEVQDMAVKSADEPLGTRPPPGSGSSVYSHVEPVSVPMRGRVCGLLTPGV